jgi:hypothetical protein
VSSAALSTAIAGNCFGTRRDGKSATYPRGGVCLLVWVDASDITGSGSASTGESYFGALRAPRRTRTSAAVPSSFQPPPPPPFPASVSPVPDSPPLPTPLRIRPPPPPPHPTNHHPVLQSPLLHATPPLPHVPAWMLVCVLCFSGTGCAWLDLRALGDLTPDHFRDDQSQLFASLGLAIASAEDEPVFSGVADGRDWSQGAEQQGAGPTPPEDSGSARSRSASHASVRGCRCGVTSNSGRWPQCVSHCCPTVAGR